MKAAAYLTGLLCSVPLVVFALGVLALGHALEMRNVFTLVYHAALAFAWGVPLVVLGGVALVVSAFLPLPRLVASGVLVATNVAAAFVVLRATGLPGTLGDGVFLGPTLVALLLHGHLFWNCTRPGRLLAARPGASSECGASSSPARRGGPGAA